MKLSVFEGVFLGCVGVLFYILNMYTPIMHDDFAYLYKYGPPSAVRPTEIPIQSIVDIFESQYYHYLDVNGRALLHFLIQLFLFFGKDIFNVFNTLVLLALIVIIYKIAVQYKTSGVERFFILTFITASVWLTSPFVGQTMLWTTGAINYLWGTLAVLGFLYYLQNKLKVPSFHWVQGFLLFVCSLLAGWTQESISIGVSAALFFYYLFNRSQITIQRVIMVLGFWVGTLFIIIAPGTLHRVDAEIEMHSLSVFEQLASKVVYVFAIVKMLKLNIAVFIVLGLFHYFKKLSFVKFVKVQSIYIVAVFFSLLFFTIIGKLDDRVFFGVNIFLILVNVSLLTHLNSSISKKMMQALSLLFILTLSYSFIQAIGITKNYHTAFVSLESNIQSSKDGIVAMPTIPNSSYVYNTVSGIKDGNNFHTRVMGFYLNVPEITILPSEVYQQFLPINTICTLKNIDTAWSIPFYWNKNFNYLVIDVENRSLPNSFNPKTQFYYKKTVTESLKPHQKFIRKALGTLRGDNETRNSYVLKLGEQQLILVDIQGLDLATIAKIEIENKDEQMPYKLEINRK